MNHNKTYAYIVIGAGSAGCVLANRLSQDPGNRVLILEAGPMDSNLMIHIPAGVHKAYKDPRINWNYQTDAEQALDKRNLDTPQGKVVGGSSSINSMVYMRGHPLDFDRWAEEFQLPQWAFDRCLPYFKQGESSDRGADQWRGGAGALGVTRGRLQNPLFDAFLEAGKQSGQGVSEDLNGYQPEGLARLDATIRHGRRCSAAVAHLKPALSRSNLTLVTRAMMRRVLLDVGRAVGVEYDHRGQTITAHAEREVILCGGAINSPKALMLSGIGSTASLESVGISPQHHLPGVGQNLQDHATVIVKYACTQPVTIHKLTQPLHKAMAGARWLFNRTGPAASNVWEMGGLVRSNNDVAYPDIQYHFAPVGVTYNGLDIQLDQAFSIHIDQSRPTSRGHIHLASADPAAKPEITFNYLSTEHDMRVLTEGVKRARELIAQPAFDAYRGREIYPGAEAQSDKEIQAFLRQYADTDFHPSCTCAMGNDDMAVVDEELRVRGIDGLRVVDASVMPQITSANLNAPTQMIAARAADFILGKPQLEPEHARYHFREQ